MNKDKVNELLTITLGALSVIAIIGILINKNFETTEILGSIVDFTQVAIPVLVLIVATTIKRENKPLIDSCRGVLTRLQEKNTDFLMGPKFNREDYDPEKGQGLEYLFITNDNPDSKQRAKLIALQPLKQGMLGIYVQKGTLVYGLNYSSDEATQDEINKIQQEVRSAVLSIIEKKYKNYFEQMDDSKNDTAIVVRFKVDKMGRTKFKKAITECADEAIKQIKKFKK